MDKTPKPSFVLVALLGALATVPLQTLRTEQHVLAQGTAKSTPTFALPDSVAAGTVVRIDGSPSMRVLNESLADRFQRRYPGTEIRLAAGGEAVGLQQLAVGNVDLAALGRSLTDEEKAQALTSVSITREKIAIIVGHENPFQGDLSFSDFVKIFHGEITNWSQVGGPDQPLRFIDRPPTSDVRRALSEYEVFRQKPFESGPDAVQVTEDNTAAVVRELGSDGISYAIAAEVLNQDRVRPVMMNTTLPDDPRYPYSQPRNYVYRGEPSIPVAAFLGFATNADGQAAVTAARRTESANVTVGSVKLPNGVALAPDGQYMVRGTEDGRLEWLDGQGQPTGKTIADAHRGAIAAVVISPDGQTVISSGADGIIRRWDRTGTPVGEPMMASNGPVLALALSPDGQTLVSGNTDGTVQRWSVKDGQVIGTPITAHNAPVQAIDYPAGGQNFITGSRDGSLAIWTADGTLASRIEAAHGEGITQITSSPDGQVFTSSGGDGTLQMWDRATFKPRGKPLSAHDGPVSAVAYNPDGSTLATTGADGTLQLWGSDGASRLAGPISLDSSASSLGFTPTGELVVGDVDGQVITRSIEDLETEAALENPQPSTLADQIKALWGRLQAMPPSTWWMLAAIPIALILLGLLGSLRGGRREELETEDLDVEPGADRTLGIDFSGLGKADPTTQEILVETAGLPPEANLVPSLEGEMDGGAGVSKLEQAKADLAEGKRLLREDRYEEALICFNSAIEATEVERLKAEATGTTVGGLNALATQAHTQRGNTLVLMGQAADAMESYNTALSLDSSTVEAWIGKGRLLVALERYEEALFCFDTALEVDESLGNAWAGKGQALLQMGRQTEAQTCLARAAALGADGLEAPSAYPPLESEGYGYGSSYPVGVYPPQMSSTAGFSATPISVSTEGYDPDVPVELQQMVMGLPSSDTDLAYAYLSDEEMPPELAAELAQLPDQPENAMGYTPTSMPESVPETLWERTPEYEVPRVGYGDVPLASVSSRSLEEELIQQVHLSGVEDWVKPIDRQAATQLDDTLQALPSTGDLLEAPPAEVNLAESDDFVSPPPEGGISEEDWSDLPPEVLSALTDIPPGSPDSFDLSAIQASSLSLEESLTPAVLSWVKLSQDPDDPNRLSVVWHLDEAEQAQTKAKGGESLAIRLYDVTGYATHMPLPDPIEEQRCHDDFTQDWSFTIPDQDRIYLAEIGYVSGTGEWWAIAQSPEVAVVNQE